MIWGVQNSRFLNSGVETRNRSSFTVHMKDVEISAVSASLSASYLEVRSTEAPAQLGWTPKLSLLTSSGSLILLTDACPTAAFLWAQWPELWPNLHCLQYCLQLTENNTLQLCFYNTGEKYNTRIADKTCENVAKSKYLKAWIAYKNYVHDNSKIKIISRNACYHQIQNTFTF
jgi:hypothetical protein